MTIALDDINRRKLILSKQLHSHAIVQSEQSQSATFRIYAIIGFDLAVETALKAVVGALDPARAPADSFQGLIQQADRLLAHAILPEIPQKANIQFVHSIRNDAQHKGKYPNTDDVSDARTYSRDFLYEVTKGVWDENFADLSLAHIVQKDEFRDYLLEAETALAADDLQGAIEKAAIALARALGKVENAFVGRFPSFLGRFVMLDTFGRPASEFDERDTFRMIERMRDTLFYAALGIDYSRHMSYRSIVGRVYFTLDGEAHFDGTKEDLTMDDAEFVIAYCTETIVQLEEKVGDLDAPYGRERWY
jgi:hypothetical protein